LDAVVEVPQRLSRRSSVGLKRAHRGHEGGEQRLRRLVSRRRGKVRHVLGVGREVRAVMGGRLLRTESGQTKPRHSVGPGLRVHVSKVHGSLAGLWRSHREKWALSHDVPSSRPNATYATGAATSIESMRSRMPPCPGRKELMSL